MYKVIIHRGEFDTKEEACSFAAALASEEKVFRVEVQPSAKARRYGVDEAPELVWAR